MDSNLLAKLVGMSSNAAHNYLMTLNLPKPVFIQLSKAADLQRSAYRSAKKRSTLANLYHSEQWYNLIAPLKYEMSNAQVGLRLKDISEAPERHAAFTAYVQLLEKLLAGLNKIERTESEKMSIGAFERIEKIEVHNPDAAEFAKSPSDIAKEKGYPNKGVHWSDWVSETTKQRIQSLFDAIPYTPKGKRFVPFKRRSTPDIAKRQREALAKRTANEVMAGYQELRVLIALNAPTAAQRDEVEERIAQYMEMLRVVDALLTIGADNKADLVPTRWQDVEVGEGWRTYFLGEGVDSYASELTAKQNMERLTARLDSAMVRLGLLEPPSKKKTNRPRRYAK